MDGGAGEEAEDCNGACAHFKWSHLRYLQGDWYSCLIEDDLPRPGAGGGAVGVGGAGQEVDHRGRGGDHHHHHHQGHHHCALCRCSTTSW